MQPPDKQRGRPCYTKIEPESLRRGDKRSVEYWLWSVLRAHFDISSTIPFARAFLSRDHEGNESEGGEEASI